MSYIREEELAAAEKVLNRVRDEWLQRPGVTGIDLGFKWSEGHMTQTLAIRVHVSEKKLPKDLDPSHLFPKELDGIPVDILQAKYGLLPAPEASQIELSGMGHVRSAAPTATTVPLGSSIGNQYTTAGTLGAKVIDLDSGDEMILSNWHVLAGSTQAIVGQSIWQPGQLDGGTADDTIANLSRWIIGPYDAAVARLNGRKAVSTRTIAGRPIEQMTTPLPGMIVWKYGRTTGLTEGIIDGAKGNVPLYYPQLQSTVLLQDVFRILPVGGNTQEITMPGDSGSVWVDKATGKAVGLHCAGETGDQPEYALAHDIGGSDTGIDHSLTRFATTWLIFI